MDSLQVQQAIHYAQMIDIDLAHLLWAGVIGVVSFFLRRELKRMDDHLTSFSVKFDKLDDKVDVNTNDITRIKSKLDIE